MRIGLTTSVIQHGQTGIARYVCSLVDAFSVHTQDNQFVLFVLEKDLPLFARAKECMELVKVPERFRPPFRNILWHQVALPRLARDLHLDVLHVPSYRRMLWPKPCALVATIHDLAPFHVKHKYDWKRMIYGRYCARALAQRQDHIISISDTTARDVTRYFGVPQRRLSVVLNGVDHGQFYRGDTMKAMSTIERRFDLTAPFFLYVARVEHPGKNHLTLISAFEQFKLETDSPCQLVFAGKDWTGAEVIHQAALQSPFAKDIRFLGFVAEADLPDLYRSAQALVCPSLYEGFGLPLVEAMACGCPVLCATSGSLAEIVGDAGLTLPAKDILAWKEHLVRLATDANLRLRLKEAGLRHAQKFDWRHTATKTLQVYAKAQSSTKGLVTEPVASPTPVG